MNKDLEKLIFNLFEDNSKTLVFTSEVVARSWLRNFTVKTQNKTVFLDRAISWDKFKSRFVNPQGLSQVSKIERQFFSTEFLKKNYNELTFFSSKHSESVIQFASAIARYLPFFAYADEKAADAYNDIKKITSAYKQFLAERGLYEYNFLPKDYSSLNKNCVLIYPETFNDPITDEITGLCSVISTKSIADKNKKIKVYPNSVSEIRNILRMIADRIDKGQDPNDLAITCACIDLYRPYLEEEAKKLDLKLCFTSSRPISSSAQGKLFDCFYNIVDNDFSFESVKVLLLNPAFPFKNRTANMNLLNEAIKLRLKKASADEWLNTLQNQDNLKYFGALSNKIKQIVFSQTCEDARLAISEFSEDFLDYDSYFFEQNGVYNKCLKLLAEIGRIVQKDSDFYILFLQVLQNENYIDSAVNGIRVYKYPVSAALAVSENYVIGLDDRNTVVSFDKYPYLPLYKKSSVNLVPDVKTGDVFAAYAGCELSGTRNGFDGARLLPVSFATQTADCNLNDIYEAERKMWLGLATHTKFAQIQKRGYENSCRKILHYEGPVAFPCSDELQNKEISASKFKDFVRCPYRGYISIYLDPEQLDMEPRYLDPRVVGNILHKTIQNSLEQTNTKTIAELTEELLAENLRKEINKAKKNHEIGPFIYQQYLERKYSAVLPNISKVGADPLFSGATLYKNELVFDRKHKLEGLDNVSLTGRIDTVLSTVDGYIVLDYKTTNNSKDYSSDYKKSNPQVALYAQFVTDNLGENVIGGGYYILDDSSMKLVWSQNSENSEADIMFDLQKKESNLINSISNAFFDYTEDSSNCEKCRYFGICRRRYLVR